MSGTHLTPSEPLSYSSEDISETTASRRPKPSNATQMPPTSAVDQIDNSHGGSSHSIGIETGDKKVAATRRTTTELRPTDVLIGRGALINSYLGNVNYRRLVRARKAAYQTADSQKVKESITREILQEIYQSNGRFLDKIQRLNEPKEQRSLEDCSWYIFPPFDAVVLEKVKQALREKKKATGATAFTTSGFDSAPLPNQNIATNQGRGQSTVTAAIGSAPLRPNRLVSILQPHVPQILSGSTMQEVAPTDVSQWLAQRLALMHEAELHQATAVPPSLPPLLPEHGNALARLLFSANGPALLHEAVAAAPIPAVPPLAITTATGLNQAAILEHLAAVLTAVDARSQVALSHPQPQVLPFPVNNTTASTIPMALPLLEALLPHASATAVVPQRHNLDGINHRALLPSQVPQASLPWPLQVAAASIAPQDISTGLLALDNLAQSLRQTSVASGALLDLHANSTRFPTNSLMPTASSMASNPTMQQLSMMLNNNQPRVPNTTEDSGYTVDGGGLLPSFASATVVNAPRLSERHRHSENQGDDTETFLSTTKRRRP